MLYIGAMGAVDVSNDPTGGGGLKTIGAYDPRIEFLLDDENNPGNFKVPGYLSAFDGDKPRLGLWAPGGV